MAGFFSFLDDEDENTQGAPQAPAPVAPKQPLSFADQYKQAAADTSSVDTAKSDAARSKMWTGILQGLSTAFAGRDKTDGGFYNGLRQDADNKVKLAQDAQQQKLTDLLAQDKLGYQDKERAYEAGNKDPAAKSANSLRTLLYAKNKDLPKGSLDEMSFEQLKTLWGTGKDASGVNGWQIRPIARSDGRVTMFRINPTTGEQLDTGLEMGFAPKTITDPITGEVKIVPNSVASGTARVVGGNPLGVDPTADANAIKPLPGETPENFQARLAGEKSRQTATGTNQAKNEQAVKEADAAVATREGLGKKWLGLYDAATKEGPMGMGAVGPVMGRVGTVANKLGVSLGPNADELHRSLQSDLTNYIKEISGSAYGEKEAERMLGTRPLVTRDRASFENYVQGLLADAEREYGKKQRVAGEGAAHIPPTASPQYSPEQEATIKAFSDKYPERTREQIISAMKKQGLL